jgi:hypothetical protein
MTNFMVINPMAAKTNPNKGEITNAIKNAREMAIMPYTKRVSQTRAGRPPRDGDRDRGERGERGPRRDEAAATEVPAELETTLIEDGIETEEAEG